MAEESAASQQPMPVGPGEIRATILLGLSFVVTMALAAWFAAPFETAGLQAFEDPENVGNSIGYIVILLAFTFLILWIAKKGKKWLIQVIILAAVGSTMAYVVAPLLLLVPAIASWMAWAVAWAVAAALTFALWKHPEWYVVDTVGILVAAGAAAIFGISLSILPVIVLLAALAVYDAIAVYKTKHMLALADSVLELRLPVLLVVPKVGHYSFLQEVARFKAAAAEAKAHGVPAKQAEREAEQAVEAEAGGDKSGKKSRDALFMGLGDLVMPTILVVSAVRFAGEGWGLAPALGAAVGTLVGFAALMVFVLRGKPQAGLPLLNGGAIAGFLAALYWATGTLVFW